MPRDQRLYMTFPIDFWMHPKVSRLSDAAFRAFVESNGHSRMRETDGVIEADDAEFLWKPEALHELLMSHPSRPLMLRLDAGDYFLRDYAEHQFTKADRDELTEKRARAGRASADKRRTSVEHVLSKEEQVSTRKEIGTGIETTTTKNPSPPKAEEFEKFWSAYPRKEGKGDARKAFAAARKKTDLATILDGLRRYKLATVLTEKQFVKMPGPWLRAERWDDEQVAIVSTPVGPSMCFEHDGYPLPCAKCDREGNRF